jgi:hypothetical protein
VASGVILIGTVLLAAGYRRIACITGPEGVSTADLRLRATGYSDDGQELSQLALSEHGGALAYVHGSSPGGTWSDIPNPLSLPTQPERQLWITGTRGDKPQLLDTGTQVNAPQFSPADDRVIWISGQRVMSAALSWHENGRLRDVGEAHELFTFSGSVRMLRFSPDGALLAYQRANGIEVYDKNNFPGERVYGSTGTPELRVITCGGVFDRRRGEHLDNIIVFGVLTG